MYFKQRGWTLAPLGSSSPQTRYLTNPSCQLLTTYISTLLHPPSICIRDRKKNQIFNWGSIASSYIPGIASRCETRFQPCYLMSASLFSTKMEGESKANPEMLEMLKKHTWGKKKDTTTSRKRWDSLRGSGRSKILFTSHTSQSMHLTQELFPPLSTASASAGLRPTACTWNGTTDSSRTDLTVCYTRLFSYPRKTKVFF